MGLDQFSKVQSFEEMAGDDDAQETVAPEVTAEPCTCKDGEPCTDDCPCEEPSQETETPKAE